MRSASAINSEDENQDDLYIEAMMQPPRINTYEVVGKETEHRGGQR